MSALFSTGCQGQKFWQQFRFASLKCELARRILPNFEFSRKWPPSSVMTQMWRAVIFRKEGNVNSPQRVVVADHRALHPTNLDHGFDFNAARLAPTR